MAGKRMAIDLPVLWGLTVAIGLLTLVAPACTPIRPIFPEVPAVLEAEPTHICTGESVEVVWDLNVPRHHSFCEYPSGGYPDVIDCTADSGCPDGGRCFDGICCASPIPFRECGSNCPADSTAAVTYDPPAGTPGTTTSTESGRESIAPTQTTAVTLTGEWGPPTTSKGPVSDRVVVVDAPPLENLVMDFLFACTQGGGWGWSAFDLAAAGIRPSPMIVVADVLNTSGREISVADGVHPAVTLRAGASTTAFNGPLAGTRWTASLTAISTIGLPLPRCTELFQSDPYPDLSIEVILACDSGRE